MSENLPLDNNRKSLIVGIDFGTFGSTYASINPHSSEKDVSFPLQWTEAPTRTCKTLSALLYEGNEVKKWGYPALTTYCRVKDKIQEHFYVEKFKMQFFQRLQQKPDQEKTVENQDQTIQEHKKHLVNFLKEFRKKVIEQLNSFRKQPINETMIKWVFAVPAFLNEFEITLMRKIIFEAGFIQQLDVSEDSLLIVSEPEAAAVFCLKDLKHQFENGEKILMIDAGGGTIDLTVHEIQNGVLKERTIRDAEYFGSTLLDQKFLEVLEGLISTELMIEFKKMKLQFYDLMQTWERLKCEQLKTLDQTLYLLLPPRFNELIVARGMKVEGYDPESAELGLNPNQLETIFNHSLEPILSLIQRQIDQLLQTEKCGLDYCYIAGGFGESEILRKAIQGKFSNHVKKGIFSPREPSKAVAGGAALLGLDDSLIHERKVTKTYGVEVQVPFESAKQDEYDFIYLADLGNSWSYKHVLSAFAKKGQIVQLNQKISKEFDVAPNEQSVSIGIFVSPKVDTKYTIDKTPDRSLGIVTKKIVTLTINTPNVEGVKRTVTVDMYFGKLDIQIQAKSSTGHHLEHTLTFDRNI